VFGQKYSPQRRKAREEDEDKKRRVCVYWFNIHASKGQMQPSHAASSSFFATLAPSR